MMSSLGQYALTLTRIHTSTVEVTRNM